MSPVCGVTSDHRDVVFTLGKCSHLSACHTIPPHVPHKLPAIAGAQTLSVTQVTFRRSPDYAPGFRVVIKHASEFLDTPGKSRVWLPSLKGRASRGH